LPMSDLSLRCCVAPAQAGVRLDQAVVALFPNLGRRQLRRLWDSYEVRVDERPRPKGYRVSAGQRLELTPRPVMSQGVRGEAAGQPHVVVATERFAALFKPAGMDTAALGPVARPDRLVTLESLAPDFFPGRAPRLLNRLDRPTSGLVMVGFGPEAGPCYRDFENAGHVEKTYVLLVHGRLDQTLPCRQALDTARRATTRVLPAMVEDSLRQTLLIPLHTFGAASEFANTTLVRAVIKKGARHQIRAHCSDAGYPIVGDSRYGQDQDCGAIYLHHARVVFPGFAAQCAPVWDQALLARLAQNS